jgi:hypothetical protein
LEKKFFIWEESLMFLFQTTFIFIFLFVLFSSSSSFVWKMQVVPCMHCSARGFVVVDETPSPNPVSVISRERTRSRSFTRPCHLSLPVSLSDSKRQSTHITSKTKMFRNLELEKELRDSFEMLQSLFPSNQEKETKKKQQSQTTTTQRHKILPVEMKHSNKSISIPSKRSEKSHYPVVPPKSAKGFKSKSEDCAGGGGGHYSSLKRSKSVLTMKECENDLFLKELIEAIAKRAQRIALKEQNLL